jgi:signal transduction histidine kinase
MESIRRWVPTGTGLVFWGYAALAWVGGFILLSWGPMWLGTDLPGQPFGKAALIRVTGAAIMAAGCFAAAMGEVADPDARQRGMRWFAAAHGIVWVIVVLQQEAIWNSPLADKALAILLILTIVFLVFRGLDNLDDSANIIQTLFGASGHARRNGAFRHDREIREAAGREERNRLARELHDSIKQQLFAIQTAAATAQTRFEPDPEGARGAIAQVRTSAREAMTEMEVLLDQLRAAPLENVGLVEALKRQCEAVGFRAGVKAAFTLGDLPPNSSLPPGAQQALFRVAQEALANVARHARAANLQVTLGANAMGRLELSIEDDGSGFDPGHRSGGMGIRNMRERTTEFDGIFELDSSPNGGTRVTAAIPFRLAATQAEYFKSMRNEGIVLTLILIGAINARFRGAMSGLLLFAGYRFLRSVSIWRNSRVSGEVVR